MLLCTFLTYQQPHLGYFSLIDFVNSIWYHLVKVDIS